MESRWIPSFWELKITKFVESSISEIISYLEWDWLQNPQNPEINPRPAKQQLSPSCTRRVTAGVRSLDQATSQLEPMMLVFISQVDPSTMLYHVISPLNTS